MVPLQTRILKGVLTMLPETCSMDISKEPTIRIVLLKHIPKVQTIPFFRRLLILTLKDLQINYRRTLNIPILRDMSILIAILTKRTLKANKTTLLMLLEHISRDITIRVKVVLIPI